MHMCFNVMHLKYYMLYDEHDHDVWKVCKYVSMELNECALHMANKGY